jgi:hypothetical protein
VDVRSYKTSNGPHSASTYALMAVDQLIQVDGNSSTDDAVAGLRLKADLLDLFTKVFDKCIKAERVELKNDSKQANKHMNPMPFMDEAYTGLVEAAKKSDSEKIKSHFSRDDVLKVHAQTLANHFGTCIHIERSWWADQNQDDDEAKIFKARFYG